MILYKYFRDVICHNSIVFLQCSKSIFTDRVRSTTGRLCLSRTPVTSDRGVPLARSDGGGEVPPARSNGGGGVTPGQV